MRLSQRQDAKRFVSLHPEEPNDARKSALLIQCRDHEWLRLIREQLPDLVSPLRHFGFQYDRRPFVINCIPGRLVAVQVNQRSRIGVHYRAKFARHRTQKPVRISVRIQTMHELIEILYLLRMQCNVVLQNAREMQISHIRLTTSLLPRFLIDETSGTKVASISGLS